MASYVNQLIHQAGGNLARPTKFITTLSVPKDVAGGLTESDIDILCKSFTIPTIKTEDVEYKFRGHTIPIVGRVIYDHTLSITFILDEGHILRTIFKNWIESLDTSIVGTVSEESSSLSKSPYQERTSTLKISALNWNEEFTVSDYIFTEVRPVSVSGPEFQTDGVSSVLECTVEFAFVSMNSGPTGNIDLDGLIDKGIDAVVNSVTNGVSTDTDGFTITYNKDSGDFFTIYGSN